MTQNIKNVVLVHGAFADGSGWAAVAKILKTNGYKVSVAQPPETSYADDQKYTKAAIDAMGGPDRSSSRLRIGRFDEPIWADCRPRFDWPPSAFQLGGRAASERM